MPLRNPRPDPAVTGPAAMEASPPPAAEVEIIRAPAAAPARPDAAIAAQLSWTAPDENRPAIPEHLIPQLIEVFQQIPDEGAGGVEGILTQLLATDAMDDLNAPWNTTSGKLLAGRRLTIRGITRRPSQFTDGPQLFLVVDSVDVKTGEPVVWTTSALAVLLQLAVAYVKGWFPLLAEVVVADRPTDAGYYPYHLNVLAAG